ncbi:MAG TPA: hypothetical protein PLD73_12600 [Candidatus Hydrogenedentes bacterium]|jgi:hypothetical protein|nr:hypothetical protein [Candidatus Hydrogenedentota bacterium]HPJ98150.1 hypothetical protein [Candidatus Hydrogenedentota bacterium]
MDELGSLLIVIIVVVASLIGKIQEQRKASEHKRSRKPVRPEDLPEATRRMLYGAPEKPPAATRREPAPVRTAQPRVAPQAARPQVVRPQAVQPPAERRPVAPQHPRPMLETAPPAAPPPKVQRRPAPQPEMLSMQARHERMMAQRMKELRDAQAQRSAMLHRAQQIRQQGAAAVAARPRTLKKAAPFREDVFSDLDDVRRGIVMMEILGAPKAFE